MGASVPTGPAGLALLVAASIASAATATTAGCRSFDDGSIVEVATCPTESGALCGVLIQLPARAERLEPLERKALCAATVLGGLRELAPGRGELRRLEGWIIDPQELLKRRRPQRHALRLNLASETSARLDVLGPLGVVVESHGLRRPGAQARRCQ